ncbi:MAG TPA: hypothetical protein VKB93_25910 [Thermoanaerobaculia bacterium]|nr:hypothetical protein [Thermoanaerobaculia bacterium]
MRRLLFLLQLFVGGGYLFAETRYFRFAPADETRFVRTQTRSGRVEAEGVMRTETTIFKARFVFRRIPSGFELTMTPLSFRYLVNDRDVETPVWGWIEGHTLRMKFNSVGKLTETRGYDEIDQRIMDSRQPFSQLKPNFQLDRYRIGQAERQGWDGHTMLWIDQKAAPGSEISFDSRERSFIGELVKSHTEMKILRAKPCGAARCVSTVYKMVPDLEEAMRRANESRNDDLIGATGSETIEQLIEPDTMLVHYERVTWQSHVDALTSEGTDARHTSLTITSEFEYAKR